MKAYRFQYIFKIRLSELKHQLEKVDTLSEKWNYQSDNWKIDVLNCFQISMACMTILFLPINDDVFVIIEQIFMEYIYYMRNIIILISK